MEHAILARLVERYPPPGDAVPQGPAVWARVERALGTALPRDYKALLDVYGCVAISDFLWIIQPQGRLTNIVDGVQGTARFIATRPSLVERGLAAYPAPGGLLAWGHTSNAAHCTWRTGGPPDAWSVVLLDRDSLEIDTFAGGLLDFLIAVLDGVAFPAIITDDWYEPPPRLTYPFAREERSAVASEASCAPRSAPAPAPAACARSPWPRSDGSSCDGSSPAAPPCGPADVASERTDLAPSELAREGAALEREKTDELRTFRSLGRPIRFDEPLGVRGFVHLVIHHFEATPPAAIAQARASLEVAGFEISDPSKPPRSGPARRASVDTLPDSSPAPTAEQCAASDLPHDDRRRLRASVHRTRIAVDLPPADATAGYREVLEICRRLEHASPGIFWDERCAVLLSRDAWALRLEGWTGGIPDVRRHITVNAEPDTEGLRMSTAGLPRFGLPELHLRHVPPGRHADEVTVLLCLVAQTLVERPRLARDGFLHIQASNVLNKAAGADIGELLHPGAGPYELGLVSFAAPLDDAPMRESIRLVFPGVGSCGTRSGALRAMLDAVLGRRPLAGRGV